MAKSHTGRSRDTLQFALYNRHQLKLFSTSIGQIFADRIYRLPLVIAIRLNADPGPMACREQEYPKNASCIGGRPFFVIDSTQGNP